MRGLVLTRGDVMQQLTRLLRVYPRPKWAPQDLESWAADYVGILDTVSREQLGQAVDAYLRSSAKFFPRPGELRSLAAQQAGAAVLARAGSYAAWLAAGFRDSVDGPLTACPVCGRGWSASPAGRTELVHDHARHRAAGEGCIGWCDGDECACSVSFYRRPAAAPGAAEEAA